jgi:hypothetical protein
MPISFPSTPTTRAYHQVFDDFNLPASATASDVMTWTSMDDGGTGTNAFQDVVGGWYNVVTAAANNDYHGLRSVNKTFTPPPASRSGSRRSSSSPRPRPTSRPGGSASPTP